jgi:mannosyltransferase OCH1-like enzyme
MHISVPLFAYWNRSDLAPIQPMVEQWRGVFPDFHVFGEGEALPLIRKHFPEHLDTFRRVRIPAAKSDVARLLLLHETGGFYVDCHYALADPEGTCRLAGQLQHYDAVFVDRLAQFRSPGQHRLINGVQLARPGLELMLSTAASALENLERQRRLELQDGFTPYNIYDVTGPGVLTGAVMQPGSDNREIRDGLRGRVLIVQEEDMPILRDQWRTYTIKGQQWHQRQRTELLFQQDPQTAGSSA